jgi:hypothetical protein
MNNLTPRPIAAAAVRGLRSHDHVQASQHQPPSAASRRTLRDRRRTRTCQPVRLGSAGQRLLVQGHRRPKAGRFGRQGRSRRAQSITAAQFTDAARMREPAYLSAGPWSIVYAFAHDLVAHGTKSRFGIESDLSRRPSVVMAAALSEALAVVAGYEQSRRPAPDLAATAMNSGGRVGPIRRSCGMGRPWMAGLHGDWLRELRCERGPSRPGRRCRWFCIEDGMAWGPVGCRKGR